MKSSEYVVMKAQTGGSTCRYAKIATWLPFGEEVYYIVRDAEEAP